MSAENKSLNENGNENSDEKHPGVKSTAIVKYASTEMPAGYHELQPNTNLNNPPSNWLYGSSKWESYIQNVSLGHEHSFSSFRMAHCYLELTGEIDVVSDSENIKKLLKMPFSNASISMMVHRVGNTLMLDDFDVHRHLLRRQQDDWKWLRQFFYETVLNNVSETQRDKWIARKNKSRDHLQDRNMFSKFLYYSMTDGKTTDSSGKNSVDSLESSHNQTTAKNSPEVPQRTKPGSLDHQRTVLWTFEDSRMLIGTDLPIFGGGTRPCISLKLRDMKKPISVLTGLDYWLDNLMCNVPELAMCYHDNGIVQSYELIKTEEIPNMNDSRFSPNVVKDVAQNILSFLKSNATKEGHTYWLFKGHNDDIVKLYDLTTLCAHLMDDQNANPFTVPVGILLYRVARNMWIGQKCHRKKMNVIHKLLFNCLKLLDAYKYSQLVTSAHYLLTDLYVADNIEADIEQAEGATGNDLNAGDNPAGSDEEDEEKSEEEEEDVEESRSKSAARNSSEFSSSVEVMALCVHEELLKNESVNQLPLHYPQIPGDVGLRCKRAVNHIAQGLKILKSSLEATNSRKNIVEEQAQCDPNTAIPLYYHPLKDDLSLVVSSRTSSQDCQGDGGLAKPSGDVNPEDDILLCGKACSASSNWQSSSRILLLRKAAIAFFRQAKAEVDAKQLEAGLKLITKALYCFAAVKKHLKGKAEKNLLILGSILCLCGDVFIALVNEGKCQKLNGRIDVEADSDEEAIIIAVAEEDLDDFEYQWICECSGNAEDCLIKSIQSYSLAQDCLAMVVSGSQRESVTKRIGNAYNVLAVFYMNMAVTNLNSGREIIFPEMETFIEKSSKNFESALKSFELLNDTLNAALIQSNFGKLLRLRATMVRACAEQSEGKTLEFTPQEKLFYSQAGERYRKALKLLGSRESCPRLYDSISWELSTVCFKMATLLQDYAPVSRIAQQKIEEEITQLMLESLAQCRALRKFDPMNEVSVDYRTGLILHRLAALYHNAFRNEANNQKKRQFRLDAEQYYAESFTIFSSLDSSVELLRLQLERVTLCEYQLSNQTSDISRMKKLQEALGHILDCIPALESLTLQLVDPASRSSSEDFDLDKEVLKLVGIMESRLQSTLQSLVKCAASVGKRGKSELSLELCKSMYAKSLHLISNELKDSAINVVKHQLAILNEIAELCNHRRVSGAS